MSSKRCGRCSRCLDIELRYLAEMEEGLWLRAHGDVTRYLNLLASWMDLFNEQEGVI